jgi:hypothetical protein
MDPMPIVRLEGLGKLKTYNDLIGNQTRDLPACSIVPQPSTLQRAPRLAGILNIYSSRETPFEFRFNLMRNCIDSFIFI